MAQMNRLKSAEISNGNLINADDLNAEFDQLLNESNDQDDRITVTETVSKADRVHLPSQASDPATLSNGDIWYNSTQHVGKIRINGLTQVFVEADQPLRPSIIAGDPVSYVNDYSVKIPDGVACRDDNDVMTLIVTSDLTLNITTSGVNGLDTGSEAANTWYYVWLIGDSSGTNPVAGVLSASATSPTLPSGYDTKRRLPIAIRNDNASAIIPFYVGEGWPTRPAIYYNVVVDNYNTASGPTIVLSGSSATSFTNISCASFIPPISTVGIFKFQSLITSTTQTAYLRTDGRTHNGFSLPPTGSASGSPSANVVMELGPSQIIEYKVSGSGTAAYLWVLGYIVTEVNP